MSFENLSGKRVPVVLQFRAPVNGDIVTDSVIGKNFYVLPATMMVEGAYCPYVSGSANKTTLYFSGEALKESVQTWNGRPVSINHPDEEETCNCPQNYDKQWLGFVFNAEYDEVGKKLKSELWLEQERGAFIVESIKNGDSVDVSIGAFGDLVPSRNAGANYDMKNIVGDHLAVLPDGIGACSWKDGCGIRAAVYCKEVSAEVQDLEVRAVLGGARSPSYDGVEDISWGNVSKSVRSYVEGFYKHTNTTTPDKLPIKIAGMPAKLKGWIASKTLLGDSKANDNRDLIFFPVVNPETNKLNRRALTAVLGGRGAQADISSTALKSAQNKARTLLKTKFKANMEGEVMAEECAEKELDSVVANEEIKDTSVAAKDNGEGNFNLDAWLGKLPTRARKYMVNSMKNYEDSRAKFVKDICSCTLVTFCKDELHKIEDNSLLESISSVVQAVEELQKNKPGVSGGVNYTLKSGIEAKSETSYSIPKDIDWSN